MQYFAMALLQVDLHSPAAPLMIHLSLPMAGDDSLSPTLGAMTKYKTFNGEEVNGQKVWRYDHHNDDDD